MKPAEEEWQTGPTGWKYRLRYHDGRLFKLTDDTPETEVIRERINALWGRAIGLARDRGLDDEEPSRDRH